MDVTPKTNRYRGSRESKKTRLLADSKAEPEASGKCQNATRIHSLEVTPPRRTISKEKEDTRRVEWEYHGRFNDTDIVVWGSPQGSPSIRPVGNIDESPIPPQNVPEVEKEVVQRNDSCEPPQFISEILALSEKIKATNNDESSSKDEINEGGAHGEEKSAFNESYSKLFDEEMNEFMVQCSQEVEETILKSSGSEGSSGTAATVSYNRNNLKEVSSKFNVKSSFTLHSSKDTQRKCVSVGSRLKLTKEAAKNSREDIISARTVPPVKRQSSCSKEKTCHIVNKCSSGDHMKTRYFYGGHEIFVSNNSAGSSSSSSTYRIKAQETDQNFVVGKNEDSGSKCDAKTTKKSIKTTLDSSFDAVKESFLEDGLDLLSTILDVPETPVSLPDSGKKAVLSTKPPSSHKQPVVRDANTNSGLDDSTFFEDNVLQYLDTLESTVSNSQPLRCTPEEIEKKRKEAKLKLEKKSKR